LRGSIKKLGENKYRVTADIGRDPATNKRKQKVVTVKGTEKDAEKALAKIVLEADRLLAEAVAGQKQAAHKRTDDLTVEGYLEEWFEAVTHDLRDNSKAFYRRLISYVKETDIARLPLAEIRPPECSAGN